MIPPLVPGQTEQQQNMVGWKNTFNMRQVTLMNLTASHTGARNGAVPHFMSGGCITSPAKSLDLLRRNLQNAINKDIDTVIKKYLEPAIGNIKMNLGKNSVNEELIKSVCLQMLDDAKNMYKVVPPAASSRDSSPYTYSDSEIGSTVDTRLEQTSPMTLKRKESDANLDTSCVTSNKHHKPSPKITSEAAPYKLPEKREGRKWDPDRITQNSLFIMGAKANKVLGFGQTRGRLYVRHPNVLRYPSDTEDKEWLAAHSLMPPSGGKAYLMLVEDVQELALSDDYRNSPNLQLQELCGFEAPPFMISKVKAFMENVRTDKKDAVTTDVFNYQQTQAVTPVNGPNDCNPSVPSITLVESHSFSTATSKQSDFNIISIPENSTTLSNSYISGHFNQSMLYSTSSLAQNVLNMDLTHNIQSSSHAESALAIVEKVKRRRILDHLISTHGTIDSS